MGIDFGGFNVVVPELLLNCSYVIYRDVVYAGFAGAKTGRHPSLAGGWRMNAEAYGNLPGDRCPQLVQLF